VSPRRFRPAARVALFLAAHGRCAACGVRLTPGWHADHVEPHARGGLTEPRNGQALCPACNLAKGARPT
jgi:5-methylcytosine-specific restriction endonuclease McrA